MPTRGCREASGSDGVYATRSALRYLDFSFEVLPYPRLFEWNIFHHALLSDACMDMDGVLCRNPLERENDEGKNYKLFLRNAEPFILPKVAIGAIVTCRLEKFRAATELWLKRHGVSYRELIMMPCKSKAERVARGHAAFKAEIYASGKFRLFIESSVEQSKEIFARTRRPVFCIENKSFLS